MGAATEGKAIMTTALQAFAHRISAMAEQPEVRMQRALGRNWVDAYTAAWRVVDEVYDLVLAPDRPLFYPLDRTVSNPNSRWPK